MARKIWKTITTLLTLTIVLMGVFVFLCVGCGSDSANDGVKPSKPVTRGKYVIFDDGNGNTYKVYCHLGSPAYTVYYEYELGKIYNFSYKIYYSDFSDNDEFTGESGNWISAPGEFNSASSLRVPADIPGEYPISVYTKLSNGSWECASLKVIVKEKPRLTPEVSFDPNGAISYVPNEKYVYKYDGYIHHPSALLSYNGNSIELNRDCVITIDSNVKSNNSFFVIDVGVYTVYYLIDDFCMENESDKGKYSVISTSIIVEIIE